MQSSVRSHRVTTNCFEKKVRGNTTSKSVAPSCCKWMLWSLTFEPVIRVTLTLTVVIWRQTWDRQEGFLRVRGQFHKPVFMSWEGHSKNSMWVVAETQIYTHLSGQRIKGIKRALTSQRCSLNIGHGQLFQPLLPTFSAVNGVDPLDQL